VSAAAVVHAGLDAAAADLVQTARADREALDAGLVTRPPYSPPSARRPL